MTPIVEPGRLRCRGDRHKPGCAHLGRDEMRQRCRGDRHRPGCSHFLGTPEAAIVAGLEEAERRQEEASRRSVSQRERRERERWQAVRESFVSAISPTYGEQVQGDAAEDKPGQIVRETLVLTALISAPTVPASELCACGRRKHSPSLRYSIRCPRYEPTPAGTT